MHKHFAWFFLFISITGIFYSQSDTSSQKNYKARKILLVSSTGIGTVGSLVGLNQLWYSSYNTGKFHFFDDNREWLQMDKVGHFYTAYQTSRLMMEAFDWAGYSAKKKLFIGGNIGLAYLTAIELMDGFSRGWGYSWGDQAADVLGSAMAITQEAFWQEQRIQMKFSFAPSGLAKYNPDLLGENSNSQILKDYNGQTYWLSINPSSFMRKENKFPKFLNVSLGYGAYGMLGGHFNRIKIPDSNGNLVDLERERRYFLSLDIDFTKIKTKSRILKGLFSVVNMLKFPAPAVQFNGKKFTFYGLYY